MALGIKALATLGMEWANAITTSNGQLMAELLNASGTLRLQALEDLVTQGLPTARHGPHRRLPLRLSDLKVVSPGEYLNYFEIKATPENSRQAMYTFTRNKTTWVIPALALQRGIFQPAKLLLGELFRPQAVERLAMADPDDPRRIKLISTWSPLEIRKAGSPVAVLEWLTWDPLARKLAASVHQHAMNGDIAIDLPAIDFDFAVYGMRHGAKLFVTKLHALEVKLSEQSSQSAGQNHFLSRATAAKKGSTRHIERSAGGALALTPAEWEKVKRHVHTTQRRGPLTRYNLKVVFENLLVYASGEVNTWAQLDALPTATKADREYYRRWEYTGAFTAMVDELNELRAS